MNSVNPSLNITQTAPDVDDRAWQVPAFTAQEFFRRAQCHCVIIPVINEGERIRQLLDHMRTLQITEVADVVLVDGGSSDGSLADTFLEEMRVRALLVKTGPGRLSAQLRCGYAYALRQGYAGIVTIDGNNKDDPQPIPQFIAALDAGVDFVQASRYIPGGLAENTPWIRDAAIRLIHAPLLRLASGFHWTDTTQGFRAYSRRLLLDPRVLPFRDVFRNYELLAYLSYCAPKLGFICQELPSIRRYPAGCPAPTKISGLRGNFDLIKTLMTACCGGYDPR